MKFGWPGGSEAIGPTLERVLDKAEAAGIHSFWPMDHFFQIPIGGQPEDPMLEAYSTLAWAAGRTRSLQLGALVTGVHYRHPGVLMKALTTIEVLSGGRAWLGIGAAWNEEESRGLGVPFPPLGERFERLEETLQIAHQMFDGKEEPFEGRHYRLERPMNHPTPVRRPPIMVGGSGEKKTLRLVAQYADANNFFEQPDLAHKLDVLRDWCDRVGRPYDDIVKTTFGLMGEPDLGQALPRFERLAELGTDLAIVDLPDPNDERGFDFLSELVRAVENMGRPAPPLLGSDPNKAMSS
jgi:F420-dependent oxidoreductase-like protein